jgi:hyaluronan synthase
MTAHILGDRSHLDGSTEGKRYEHMPSLQTGDDDIDTMKKSLDPDSEFSSRPIKWKVEYSNSIKVNVEYPRLWIISKATDTMEKSFIRSLFATGGIFWKRPPLIALLYYIQTAMKPY